MIQLNSSIDFDYPPLTNYVLARVASETEQTKISPEDIVDVQFLKSHVLISYLDWEGELNSSMMTIDRFRDRAQIASIGEGIVETAKSLIKGSTDLKLETIDLDNRIEFVLAELEVTQTATGYEPTTKIVLIIFTAHKHIDFWQVESAEGERIFTDKQQAISYFKSLYYSFATNFSIGQVVDYRGIEWQVDRFTKTKAVLVKKENDDIIYTSVSIVEGELIGAGGNKVSERQIDLEFAPF